MILKDNIVSVCVLLRNFRPRGLGLGNIGVAVMIYTISKFIFKIESIAILAFVCIFMIFGLTMMISYIFSFVIDPKKFYQQELSNLEGLARVGTFSMAVSLLGKLLFMAKEFQLPMELTVAIVGIGATLQFVEMLQFFRVLYLTYPTSIFFPEPYYHNAIFSCAMTAIALPNFGDTSFAIKSIGMSIALLLVIPNVCYIGYHVIDKPSTIATNPVVAMTQSAGSLTCQGWFSHPLVGDLSDGSTIGGAIGHFLFAFSTAGFFVTVFAIWQRRDKLWSYGQNAGWAGKFMH